MTIVLFLSSCPEAKPKNAFTPMHVQMRDLLQHILVVFHRVDPLEFVRAAAWLGRVDRFFVHPARVIIADLLRLGSSLRIEPCVCAAFSAIAWNASLFCSISSLKLPQRDSSGGIRCV